MSKKILLVSDSPFATTGLGRMSRYFLKMLPEYHWTVWASLHPDFFVSPRSTTPVFDKAAFKGKVDILSPRSYTDDQWGFDYLLALMQQSDFDILLTSLDFDKSLKIVKQLKELQLVKGFKWVNYFPFDREDFKYELEGENFRFPDVNVCITKFGQQKLNEVEKHYDIKQIYHPIDKEEFPYVEPKDLKEFKSKTWKGLADDKFMVGTVNRSFFRKDTSRLIKIFSEFLKNNDDTFAYVHGSKVTFDGTDLKMIAEQSSLPPKRLSFMPSNVQEISGVSNDSLNKIYRNLDMFVTVSMGEGFGFSTVEALLMGIPVVAPKNTSFPELVQDFGYLVEPSEFTFTYNGHTCMWPIVNIDDVVKQMQYVYDNYDEAKEKARAGSAWVKKELSLVKIAKQWRKIFNQL